MTKDEIIKELYEALASIAINAPALKVTIGIISHVTEAVKALPDPKELSRDEFAAAALTGLLASGVYWDNAVKWSQFAADAMIEARKQTPKT